MIAQARQPVVARMPVLYVAVLTMLMAAAPALAAGEQWAADDFKVVAASYVGGAGDDDAVVAARILSDGAIVLAANISDALPGQGQAQAPVYKALAGAAVPTAGKWNKDADGALIKLSQDGRRVISCTWLGGKANSLSIDSRDRIYVATSKGFMTFGPDAQAPLAEYAGAGNDPVRFVSASPGGFVVYAGKMFNVLDPAGKQIGTVGWAGDVHDVCIDEVNKQIIQVGFRQTYTPVVEGVWRSYPVQIAFVHAYGFDGQRKWVDYDWTPAMYKDDASKVDAVAWVAEHIHKKTKKDFATDAEWNKFVDSIKGDFNRIREYDGINPRWVNRSSDNMADTRGLKCIIGDDGKLWVAFESAGGNHIFRFDPKDIMLPSDNKRTAMDGFHGFNNTGASHKTVIGRYEPATGELIKWQMYNSLLWNKGPSANALFIGEGGLCVDATGTLLFGGAAGWALPMPPNTLYSSGTEAWFNPLGLNQYLGGAFLWVMDQDMAHRRFVTRLSAQGKTRTVDSRFINGKPRVVWAGQAPLNEPSYTKAPFQKMPGWGKYDGFVAVAGRFDLNDPKEAEVRTAGLDTSKITPESIDLLSADSLLRKAVQPGKDGEEMLALYYPLNLDKPLPAFGKDCQAAVGLTIVAARKAVPDKLRKGELSLWHQKVNGAAGLALESGKAITGKKAVRLAVLFPKSSLGATAGQKLSIIRSSQLAAFAAMWGRAVPCRLALVDSGKTYISKATFNGGMPMGFECDTDNGLWAQFMLAEADGVLQAFDPATAKFETRNFQDITAVGMLLDIPEHENEIRSNYSAMRFVLGVDQTKIPAPTPSFVLPGTVVYRDKPVTIDGSAAKGYNGSVSFASFDFGDGQASGGLKLEHVYTVAGRYVITQHVWDDRLNYARTQRTIEVVNPDLPKPERVLVSFGGSNGNASESFTFARDGGRTAVKLAWDGRETEATQWGRAFSDIEPLYPGRCNGGDARFGCLPIYGGVTALATGDPEKVACGGLASIGGAGVNLNPPADFQTVINFPGGPRNAGATSIQSLIFFRKQDFLNQGADRKVSLRAGDELRIGFYNFAAPQTTRWVVRDGDEFFISNVPAITPPKGRAITYGQLTFGKDAVAWAKFDPKTQLRIDGIDKLTYAAHEFSNVTGVGFYWIGTGANFCFNRFDATATIAP